MPSRPRRSDPYQSDWWHFSVAILFEIGLSVLLGLALGPVTVGCLAHRLATVET
jgi:hypothetical protein